MPSGGKKSSWRNKEKENKTNRSDSKEEPFIPPPAKIKQEPDTNPLETVLAEDVEKNCFSSPTIGPFSCSRRRRNGRWVSIYPSFHKIFQDIDGQNKTDPTVFVIDMTDIQQM